MAKVATRPAATADIAGIVRYLRRQAGPSVADDYRSAFKAAFRRLTAHPEIGARRPALGVEVRVVIVDPDVVLHRYDRAADTVFVLRVLHGRRRLSLDVP